MAIMLQSRIVNLEVSTSLWMDKSTVSLVLKEPTLVEIISTSDGQVMTGALVSLRAVRPFYLVINASDCYYWFGYLNLNHQI